MRDDRRVEPATINDVDVLESNESIQNLLRLLILQTEHQNWRLCKIYKG